MSLNRWFNVVDISFFQFTSPCSQKISAVWQINDFNNCFYRTVIDLCVSCLSDAVSAGVRYPRVSLRSTPGYWIAVALRCFAPYTIGIHTSPMQPEVSHPTISDYSLSFRTQHSRNATQTQKDCSERFASFRRCVGGCSLSEGITSLNPRLLNRFALLSEGIALLNPRLLNRFALRCFAPYTIGM